MKALNLNDEQLNEVKNFAKLLFLPKEISILIGLPTEQQAAFIHDCSIPGNKSYESFLFGRLTTESEIRKTIVENAIAGSKDAQTLAIKYLNDVFFDE